MTKEEVFKKNFPEYVTEKGECLSPYWDLFSAGIECATYELNKGCIQTFIKENAELKEIADRRDNIIEALKKQIAEMDLHNDKAIELIEDIYAQIPSSHSDYYKDVMERARQFLSEVE